MVVMDKLLGKQDICTCKKTINYRKTLIKIFLKMIISGIFKAIITHIVLSHLKN